MFLVNSVWQDNSDQMAHQAGHFLLRYVRESRSEKQFAAQGLKATTVPGPHSWLDAKDRRGADPDQAGCTPTRWECRRPDLLYALHREDARLALRHDDPTTGTPGGTTRRSRFERLTPPVDETFPLTLRLRMIRLMKRTLLVRGYAKNLWRRLVGDLERVPTGRVF